MSGEVDSQRFERLERFLVQDPTNAALLDDAVGAALAAGATGQAHRWLERAEKAGAEPGRLRNLEALMLLHAGDLDGAIECWQTLAAASLAAQADPGLRHNLAYALMLAGRATEAEPLLDEATVTALPRAAALRVRLLHGLQRFDEAMAFGRSWLAGGGTDPELAAYLSTLAIDLEDFDAAADLARQAGDRAEALTSLGQVALSKQDLEAADCAFDQALARRPESFRAWIGAGLTALARKDFDAARQRLQHAVDLAPLHLGSRIALAWAHLCAWDLDGASAVLRQAEEVDQSFAETQGCLAVVAVLQGHTGEGQHRMQAALRLDGACLSARLAQSMLLEAGGQPDAARAIVEKALTQPIGSGVALGVAVQRMAGARTTADGSRIV
jgi:tetratricopeptide (TPR) repeat protein